MKRLAVALVLAVTLGPAGSVAAAPTSSVRLSVGDAVDVVNTKIACYAIKSNGKVGMACALLKGSKPQTASYGVGLAADGTAVVTKVRRDGSGTKVFNRRLQSHARVYRAHVGDLFGLQLTKRVSIGCRVIRVTSSVVQPLYRGLKVSCWRATATAPLPQTYGVSISDKFAGVFRFDSKGRVTTWGWMRKQPR